MNGLVMLNKLISSVCLGIACRGYQVVRTASRDIRLRRSAGQIRLLPCRTLTPLGSRGRTLKCGGRLRSASALVLQFSLKYCHKDNDDEERAMFSILDVEGPANSTAAKSSADRACDQCKLRKVKCSMVRPGSARHWSLVVQIQHVTCQYRLSSLSIAKGFAL